MVTVTVTTASLPLASLSQGEPVTFADFGTSVTCEAVTLALCFAGAFPRTVFVWMEIMITCGVVRVAGN